MSYVPGSDFGAQGFAMPQAPSGQDLEPLNLGPNIFLAKPGDLPPEAFNSRTPTVQHLPDKIVKNNLPPLNNTENLPPKFVKTRVAPIFPPGQQGSLNIPNL